MLYKNNGLFLFLEKKNIKAEPFASPKCNISLKFGYY